MTIPFRSNPKITTNWIHSRTGKVQKEKGKKAYYEIYTNTGKGLGIRFREEKKRLGGSAEREEHWYGYLGFELDSTFAKDLKMFLNEYVKGDAPEAENTIRIYREKHQWCARKGKEVFVYGETIVKAIENLAKKVEETEQGKGGEPCK